MKTLSKFQTRLKNEKTLRRQYNGEFVLPYKKARRDYHRASRRLAKIKIKKELDF